MVIERSSIVKNTLQQGEKVKIIGLRQLRHQAEEGQTGRNPRPAPR
jgi:nucleoid DNA-binding protein